MTSQNIFMRFLWRKSQMQTYFDRQFHSSHNKNKDVEASVPELSGNLPRFLEILPGFLANQNFWGCACNLCTPAPYITVNINPVFAQTTRRASTQHKTRVSRKCARVCMCLHKSPRHQHASAQCVCKSHPDFQGEQLVQNFATCTRINTVFT